MVVTKTEERLPIVLAAASGVCRVAGLLTWPSGLRGRSRVLPCHRHLECCLPPFEVLGMAFIREVPPARPLEVTLG